MKILSADFVTSATAPEGWPRSQLPEVAFAGRSNVGKSSMINALCQRHKLVRVSNTPGRTRLLNFFEVSLEEESGARHRVRLCDLPGYGFAKVSKAERRDWREMIDSYVNGREPLCAVVCIVDANVGPTDEDAQVIEWVRSAGRRAIVAATKIDKLPKHRRIPRTREVERLLGLEQGDAVGVSSTDKLNLEALWEKIFAACDQGSAKEKKGGGGDPWVQHSCRRFRPLFKSFNRSDPLVIPTGRSEPVFALFNSGRNFSFRLEPGGLSLRPAALSNGASSSTIPDECKQV